MKYITNFFFSKIFKKVSIGLSSSGGRNFLGRICVFHRGGGNKVKYLLVDRFRRLNQYGFIYKIFSKRPFTAFIGAIIYDNGLHSFIILSDNLFVGSYVFSGISSESTKNLGSSGLLSTFSLFSPINSLELFPFSGAKLSRAAGSSAFMVGRDFKKVLVKLNSGWQIKVSPFCVSSLGIVSNPFHYYKVIGKAGKARSFGIRPTVRGVIKNPCDHPHGGGEGKGSPPAAQVSPWGRLTKGTPTKRRKIDKLKKRLFKLL